MSLLTTTDITQLLGRGTTVHVTDIETGKTIARQWFQSRRDVWSSVELDVAAWFECEPDDVGLTEDEDGCEVVMVKGEVVAKYEVV